MDEERRDKIRDAMNPSYESDDGSVMVGEPVSGDEFVTMLEEMREIYGPDEGESEPEPAPSIDELEERAEGAQSDLIALINERGYGHLIEDKPNYGELRRRLNSVDNDSDREVLIEQYDETQARIGDLETAMRLTSSWP